GGTPAAGATSSAAVAVAKPVPIVLPSLVARVNGEEITRADLERSIRGVETQLNQKMPADKRDGVVRGVLERLINYRLLLQEAKARGIEVPQSEIDAQLIALARQFPSQQALEQALIVRGVTVDMLREDARRDLRVAKLVKDEAGKDVSVPAADVRKFYDANLERFRESESAQASHVFVRVDPAADQKTKSAMKVRAESIMRLAKRGDDFAGLARNYSDDRATGNRGGDLGSFSKGTAPKEFDDVVFALNPGDVGGLAQTQDGFHIIKVVGRKPSRIKPFEAVQMELATFLLRELQDRLTIQLINRLKAKGKIEVLL
ncbi:MAG: peptidylprolyl isomerase, partial [Acidobacteriota bacterium]|nr:peptidylprolyl isomerase [Acidobacteriota bacterium]